MRGLWEHATHILAWLKLQALGSMSNDRQRSPFWRTSKQAHFMWSWWPIQKSCKAKFSITLGFTIRHQYVMRRRRTTVHEKVLSSDRRGTTSRDRLDSSVTNLSTKMIEDAAQAPLSVAPRTGKHVGEDLTHAWYPVVLALRTMILSSAQKE